MPVSSSLTLDSERLRIIKYASKVGEGYSYDIYTKVYNTASNLTPKEGYNVTYNVTRKAIVKNLVKADWYGGLVTNDEYRNVRFDVNSSLTN